MEDGEKINIIIELGCFHALNLSIGYTFFTATKVTWMQHYFSRVIRTWLKLLKFDEGKQTFFLAVWNNDLTRRAPTPTNLPIESTMRVGITNAKVILRKSHNPKAGSLYTTLKTWEWNIINTKALHANSNLHIEGNIANNSYYFPNLLTFVQINHRLSRKHRYILVYEILYSIDFDN